MSQNVDTTIQFSGLKPGTYNYSYTLDNSFFSDYKNEKILDAKVFFDVKMEKKERMILIIFNFSGTVRTMCDRCLGDLEIPVEGEQTICVKFSDTESSDDENVVFLPENEYKIDLAQWMYEFVAVSIPIQTIHPEDENGVPMCDPEMTKYLSDESENGEDETATDPRWEALKNLR